MKPLSPKKAAALQQVIDKMEPMLENMDPEEAAKERAWIAKVREKLAPVARESWSPERKARSEEAKFKAELGQAELDEMQRERTLGERLKAGATGAFSRFLGGGDADDAPGAGWADEVYGGLKTVGAAGLHPVTAITSLATKAATGKLGQEFEANRQEYKTLDELQREEDPASYGSGALAGDAVQSLIPAAKGAQLSRLGARAALNQGGRLGFLTGAAMGAGTGDSLEERGINALIQGGTGVVTGGLGAGGAARVASVSPVVRKALAKTGKAVKSKLPPLQSPIVMPDKGFKIPVLGGRFRSPLAASKPGKPGKPPATPLDLDDLERELAESAEAQRRAIMKSNKVDVDLDHPGNATYVVDESPVPVRTATRPPATELDNPIPTKNELPVVSNKVIEPSRSVRAELDPVQLQRELDNLKVQAQIDNLDKGPRSNTPSLEEIEQEIRIALLPSRRKPKQVRTASMGTDKELSGPKTANLKPASPPEESDLFDFSTPDKPQSVRPEGTGKTPRLASLAEMREETDIGTVRLPPSRIAMGKKEDLKDLFNSRYEGDEIKFIEDMAERGIKIDYIVNALRDSKTKPKTKDIRKYLMDKGYTEEQLKKLGRSK
jgi:hypothetical protein